MSIKLNAKYTEDFVSKTDLESIAPEIKKAHKTLTEKSGAGNDFLGWVDLPENYDIEEFERIKKAAEKIRSDSQVLIVIGISAQERLLNFVNHRITIWYAKIRRRYSSPETV